MTPSEPATDWSEMGTREVAAFGLDEIARRFAAEGFAVSVDDERGRTRLRVERGAGGALEVRVATMRQPGTDYAFFTKQSLELADNVLVALVLLEDGHAPRAFLIPSTAWREPTPLLRDRDYEGKASAPEWGVQLTGVSRPLLEEYSFAQQVRRLGGADLLDTAGIQDRLRAFRDERDWQQFHDPRSLTLALVAEVGELADSLSWRDGEPEPADRDALADELADITTYVLHLANTLGVDLGAEVERKLHETRRRFADLPPGTPSRK